jgi:hypothetical protein
MLEEMRETLTGQPRRRWWPWRRMPSLADQTADLASEVLVVPLAQPLPQMASTSRVVLPETVFVPEEEQAGPGRKVASSLKRAATRVGERINDLSDGRYGLETERMKQAKKEAKHLSRQERKAVKQAEKASRGSGAAWAVGLSLGLVIGLLGMAYWQRRRLQRLWGETSQRMRASTEELLQRFDAQRGAVSQPGAFGITPEARVAGQPEPSQGATTFTSLGSAAPATDLGQQTNGRVESGT